MPSHASTHLVLTFVHSTAYPLAVCMRCTGCYTVFAAPLASHRCPWCLSPAEPIAVTGGAR